MLVKYICLAITLRICANALNTNQSLNALRAEGLKAGEEEKPLSAEVVVVPNDRNITKEEIQARVNELVAEIARMISDDIAFASKEWNENGKNLNEKETEEFFQSVAFNTLDKIAPSISELSPLTKDTDRVAQQIADKISGSATKQGMKHMMNSDDNSKSTMGGLLEITSTAKEFIKMALLEEAEEDTAVAN